MPASDKVGNARAAARGQRRGFYWQDWYAAWIMLRCWAEPAEGITAVEVEAIDAPHVDDIIVHYQTRSIFCQLKHTVGGKFTGSDLFGKQEGGTFLIGKLFKGWTRVRGRSVGNNAEVHLITNAIPSDDTRNQPISPVAFQRQILQPARSKTWVCPDLLKPVLEEIRGLTGASDWASLNDFLAALRLDFTVPDENELRGRVTDLLRDRLRPGATAETEADAWMARVYDLSTQHSATGRLSRSDIDREVRSLFRLTSRKAEHRLALPDHHVPRPELVAAILQRAQDLGSGYLTVLGPPGSGKTTLATWIANEHDDKILMRYHVFDPKKASGLERKGRASALEFVRTMFDVLTDRFPGKASPYVPAEDTLPTAVGTLRDELGRLAEVAEDRRILVIDGIDHVVRAGVEQPLFDALPQPPPPNVVFVLFGQPDWPYPTWLAKAPRVPIPPFTEVETRSQLCGHMGWHLDDLGAAAIADTLHERAKGNPLSLFYNLAVVERLGKTPEDVSLALPKAVLFGGAPHEEYDRLLADLEGLLIIPPHSKSLRRDLLACLAVAGVAITEERLSAAFSEDGLTLRQARDYLEAMKPVIVERENGRFWLFHDDFRRYAEENTDSIERTTAHRRLARAIEKDWENEELQTWAEHLWLGGEDLRLANLPVERHLEHWFQAAAGKAVVTMHRFALAAAFRLGEETRILRNALALERAVVAADLSQADAGIPPEPGFKEWSFVVPPLGSSPESLHRRALALQAAADGFQREPSLAIEIATRFLLRPEDTLETVESHDSFGYIRALAKWFLRSGDLGGARELATSDDFGTTVIPALIEEFYIANNPDVLDVWAATLVGINDRFDRDLAGSALLHLSEGREISARSLARALAWSSSPTAETDRDAAVLLSLIEGSTAATDAKHLKALVRINDQNTTQPEEWRELFFHGFVTAASGPVRDLGLCEFPDRFTDSTSGKWFVRDHDKDLAVFLWRCGCAAGFACRGPDLLTPRELSRLLSTLIGKNPEFQQLQQYTLSGMAGVYLPAIVLALRHRDKLAATACELIVPAARELLFVPSALFISSALLYGLLEATWFLDSGAWRAMASEAYLVTHLPGTEWFQRVEWFKYWTERSSERGIEVPPEFIARSSIAALGVPRKTDPARLAVDLLCERITNNLDRVDGIRRLVDLIIQLRGEPEGGRAARRQLPRVLSLALQVDPSLFYDEFLRSTVEYEVDEPFDDLPAEIASLWLEAAEPTTADELLALWYWVAACPGGFAREGEARVVGRIIEQRLATLGNQEEAARVRRWNAALSERVTQTVGEVPTTAVVTSTTTDADNLAPNAPSKPTSPHISGLNARWFSSWLSPNEHQVLREFLGNGGDEAWRWVCEHAAEQFAAGSEFVGDDASLIAGGLAKLRSFIQPLKAFEIASHHLAEKVRFQREPSPRESTSPRKSHLEVLVSLVARGIDVSDVETLRRSLRSLGALARNPGTAPAVEQEMSLRLNSDEPRALIHALIILRQVAGLTQETCTRVRNLIDHPDIWCRWLACSILKIEPRWGQVRSLTSPPAIISHTVSPAQTKLGARTYSDITSSREIYLQKFKALLDAEDEPLRSWLETELRDLPLLQERSSGWHRNPGATLVDHRMRDAAGRLACRLASVVAPSMLPALMSLAAGQDPWLVVAEPVVEPPNSWIEVCRSQTEATHEREEYLLRSLSLVPNQLLADADKPTLAAIAEAGCQLLAPCSPKEFAWVAEQWSLMAPPRIKRHPILPLSFLSSPFMELRDRFTLVPLWSLPPFRELRFEVSDVPRWVHPKTGPVLVGAYREHLVGEGGVEHPRMAWWTGWYASPSWLKTFLQPNTSLIRFWRLEWRRRHWGKTEGESTVEYGMEEDVIG